jgi:hypothetical protein
LCNPLKTDDKGNPVQISVDNIVKSLQTQNRLFGSLGWLQFVMKLWVCQKQGEEMHTHSPILLAGLVADPDRDACKCIAGTSVLFCNGTCVHIEEWKDKELLWQCTMCHSLGHLAKNCTSGLKKPCRATCSSNKHVTNDHNTNCNRCKQKAPEPGMECVHVRCQCCFATNHVSFDMKCPKKGTYVVPSGHISYLRRPKPKLGAAPPRKPAVSGGSRAKAKGKQPKVSMPIGDLLDPTTAMDTLVDSPRGTTAWTVPPKEVDSSVWGNILALPPHNENADPQAF